VSGLLDELAARWERERIEREADARADPAELDPASAATALEDLHTDGEYEDQPRWRP
jgi:hypothetical protein